jgi:hypothetical protein
MLPSPSVVEVAMVVSVADLGLCRLRFGRQNQFSNRIFDWFRQCTCVSRCSL